MNIREELFIIILLRLQLQSSLHLLLIHKIFIPPHKLKLRFILRRIHISLLSLHPILNILNRLILQFSHLLFLLQRPFLFLLHLLLMELERDFILVFDLHSFSEAMEAHLLGDEGGQVRILLRRMGIFIWSFGRRHLLYV